MARVKTQSQQSGVGKQRFNLKWGARKVSHDKRCRELFEKFEFLAQREKRRGSAHRKAIYSGLAEVAAEKLTLDGDPAFEKIVLRRIGEKNGWPETRSKGKRYNVCKELCSLAMGAATREQEKLASKRGKVVQILLDDDVEPSDFLREIKRRGGIEKIAASTTPKERKNDDTNGETFAIRVGCKASAREKWISAAEGSSVTVTGTKVGERGLCAKTLFVVGEAEIGDDDDDNETNPSLDAA